jgi:hypothetical protein
VLTEGGSRWIDEERGALEGSTGTPLTSVISDFCAFDPFEDRLVQLETLRGNTTENLFDDLVPSESSASSDTSPVCDIEFVPNSFMSRRWKKMRSRV